MARRKRRSKAKQSVTRENGTVYVLELEVEGIVVYKVGATMNSSRRRALQVLESIEKEYGYFPKCTIIREEKCKGYYQVERRIQKALEGYSWESRCTFSGCSELFKANNSIILEIYDTAMSSSVDAEYTGSEKYVW